jgi:hypothetical protein
MHDPRNSVYCSDANRAPVQRMGRDAWAAENARRSAQGLPLLIEQEPPRVLAFMPGAAWKLEAGRNVRLLP